MAKRSFEGSGRPGCPVVDIRTGAAAAASAVPVVCERIRFYRKRLGLEGKALAAALGVTGNAVSNWEAGRSRPDLALIPRLCQVLGVSPSELFDMAPPARVFSPEEEDLVLQYRALGPGSRFAVRTLVQNLNAARAEEGRPAVVRLPLVDRALAAGTGDPTELEENSTPILLYASRLTERASYVFSVNGDSMEPAYRDGDLVLVQAVPDGPDLQPGEVGAFVCGNEQFIKVFREEGLESLNPAYPFMNFSNTSETVYLIGRVLGKLAPGDIAALRDLPSARD